MECSQCHNEFSSNVAGNCPACLFSGALEDPSGGELASESAEAALEVSGYDILSEIGRGGSGVVYRAVHRRLNRVVALKTLHGGLLGSGEAFERFRIEAQAIARLDHPNIVPLYETGGEGGLHYLTLRYFEQGSLAAALKTRRFSVGEAARVIAAAARAIHYAHQRGVLHRDLKPSNLLLDEAGEAHITDFGLAKLADGDTSLTLSSSVLGTPNYMAPEQADGRAKDASLAVDIYSLGAILFELLTGRPPFVGETPLAVLRQVADHEPPRPRSLNSALDRDLEAICLCCLEKEPERRYASAAALGDDLERWLRREPISARSASALERAAKWVRRRPLVAALAALAVVALGAGLAGTTWQWNVARRTAEAARRDAYLSSMDLVQRLAEFQPQRAKDILDRFRPQPGQDDLRGWEWRYLWQLCRGDRPERRWTGEKPLLSSAISPDGKLVAIGEFSGGVKIFDAESLRLVFSGAEDVNTNLAPYMPSGNRMGARVLALPGATQFVWSETRGQSNCVLQFWDWRTRQIVRSVPQPYIVRNIAASGDGRRLVVSYQTFDGRTIVWDWPSGKMITQIPKGDGRSNFSIANVLAVSPDGKWMTYDEFPSYVRVIEVETGKDVRRFPLEDQYCLSCEFSPDGTKLAVCGGFDKGTTPQVWDLETGQNLGPFEAVPGWMSRLRFSEDGRLIYASGSSDRVNIWDLAERRLRGQIRVFLPSVFDFVLSPKEDALFTVSNRRLSRWNLHAPAAKPAQKLLPIASRWRFMPDSKHILGVTTNGTVALFGGPDWSERREFGQGMTNARSVNLLARGTGYVAGAQDGTITARAWDDRAPVKLIGKMEGPVSYLAVDPKTGNIVSADGRSVAAWETSTGRILAAFPDPHGEGSADLLPGKSRWTLLTYDGTATHIDLASGRVERQKLPYNEAEGFSYSPSGEFAVTSGAHVPVRIYRAADWTWLRDLGEDSRGGFFPAFSPDGRRIATGHSGNEAIRLWDVITGRRVCVLSAELDLARDAAFSPDGNAIAESGSVMRAVSIWRAPSWEEISRVEAAGEY